MRSVAFSVEACAVKRAAVLVSALAFSGLAGCSSQNSRFDGYGFDSGFSYASTGSVPRDAGYANQNGDSSLSGAYDPGYSRGYASPSGVSRETLPPLAGSYDARDAYSRPNPPAAEHKSPGAYQTADGYSALNGRGAYERADEGPDPRDERRESGYPRRGGEKEIVVAPGDTLYGIALRFGVSARELEEANDLRGSSLRAGQTLIIPTPGNGAGYERRSQLSNGREEANGYDAGGAYSASRAPSRGEADENGEQCPNCYTVKAGDSFFTIGQRYGMGPAPIAHLNRLSPSSQLRAGQVLMIPDNGVGHERKPSYDAGRAPLRQPEKFASNRLPAHDGMSGQHTSPRERIYPVERADTLEPQRRDGADLSPARREPLQTASPRPDVDRKRIQEPGAPESRSAVQGEKFASKDPEKLTPSAPPKDASDCEDLLANPAPRSSDTFRQPVDGLVISKFGKKDDGTINDGVNYAVPKGTPVKAAENGVVAYVGTEISGFGNLILIRHAGDYVSAYAHNDEVMVKRCDIVKRGQVVAKAGATGAVSKPQLHFELRKNSKPVNPEEVFTAAKEP